VPFEGPRVTIVMARRRPGPSGWRSVGSLDHEGEAPVAQADDTATDTTAGGAPESVPGGRAGDSDRPVSAGRLAELLGDSLPLADTVPPESFELVLAARRLVEAVVMTDLDASGLAAATARIDELTADLSAARRDEPLRLVRHPDGRIESLLQAAAGRLNPQALPIEWVHRPTEPPPGSPVEPVEVVARCTFTASHAGSPGRVHGGVAALALDEVTGIAVRAAGASGLTVRLEVSLKGAVPLNRPVEIRARYTRGEGRKAWSTGEIVVDGEAVVSAESLYVMERR
jgi:acyl-coenzyme A thioesterase PaaI-like protein